MLKFDTIRNGAIAALFSVILTVTAVSAAVGPVHVSRAAPVASARA